MKDQGGQHTPHGKCLILGNTEQQPCWWSGIQPQAHNQPKSVYSSKMLNCGIKCKTSQHKTQEHLGRHGHTRWL